jgi:hypothetical protein
LDAIDEATKKTQLIESWYRTRLSLAPDQAGAAKSALLRELDSALESVRDLAPPVVSPSSVLEQSRIAHLGKLRRWFLLYRPSRRRAWVPRAFFYTFALYPVALFAAFLSDPVGLQKDEWMGIAYLLIGDVALSLLFRWFARSLE